MPCIFCLAVFAMLAGAVTTVVLDQMEARLAAVAATPVTRAVDSASVAKVETSVVVPGTRDRRVPVSVTVYKKYKRVRIQVMTHELSRAEAEAVEDLVARALDLRIVDRSDAHDEQKVREAFGVEAEELTAEAAGTEAATAEAAGQRLAGPAEGEGDRAR